MLRTQVASGQAHARLVSEVPPVVAEYLQASAAVHLAHPETTGRAVPVAFMLCRPVKGEGGADASFLRWGGVLQEEDTTTCSMAALEALMKYVHLHVARDAVLEPDPPCPTHKTVMEQARADAGCPLHRVIRALMTGSSAVPSTADCEHVVQSRALAMPWSITEQIRKYLMPSKRGGLHYRAACALWEDNQEAREQLFSFLCIAMPKCSWQRRLDAYLSSSAIKCAPDSYVLKIFDNLGYDRKGGPTQSRRFETVAQSLKEISWGSIVAICGADSANSLEKWGKKCRTTLSLATYLPAPPILEFLGERWCAEVQEAIAVEYEIHSKGEPPTRDDGRKFTCRNEFYDVGLPGPDASEEYIEAEIARQQAIVEGGDSLTLNNRNNLRQVARVHLFVSCNCHSAACTLSVSSAVPLPHSCLPLSAVCM